MRRDADDVNASRREIDDEQGAVGDQPAPGPDLREHAAAPGTVNRGLSFGSRPSKFGDNTTR